METSLVAVSLGLLTLLVIALIWYFDDSLLDGQTEKLIAGGFAAAAVVAIAWGGYEHGKAVAAPAPPPPATLPAPMA